MEGRLEASGAAGAYHRPLRACFPLLRLNGKEAAFAWGRSAKKDLCKDRVSIFKANLGGLQLGESSVLGGGAFSVSRLWAGIVGGLSGGRFFWGKRQKAEEALSDIPSPHLRSAKCENL